MHSSNSMAPFSAVPPMPPHNATSVARIFGGWAPVGGTAGGTEVPGSPPPPVRGDQGEAQQVNGVGNGPGLPNRTYIYPTKESGPEE
jgi:hypothetical protein